MTVLVDFYQSNLQKYTNQSIHVRRRLRYVSYLRLVAFALAILLLYVFRQEAVWATVATLFGMALFLFLVKYHENLKQRYRYLHTLAKLNATELKVLNHDYQDLDTGETYKDEHAHFSHDLDLFGIGSFFQYLNRTALAEGTDFLAQLLQANEIDAIAAKQETIDELAQKPGWRQAFTAHAQLLQHQESIANIISWVQDYKPFVPKVMRWLPWSFLCLTLFFGYMVFWIDWPENILIFWVVLGLGITSAYFKKITKLASNADRAKGVFSSYSQLLEKIENTEYNAAQLRFQKQKLMVNGAMASQSIKRFSRLLNKMDYNNNIFYAIFGNGCFLGALQTAYHIEQWIETHGKAVSDWFGVIAFFDAWNSLGNFSFNHPLYSYPTLKNGPTILRCMQAGHPLIQEPKNVKNDFAIEKGEFFIVTGSNMAGKSTFLRTVGLTIVMANIGLPVCASECFYTPMKLVSSMRSIDSLHKGDSYFLSELKRLKVVVEALEREPYFVLLDEILRGTNSHDKAIGSKKFVERMVGERATGIIATHDLSLCALEDRLPEIQNYYLDASLQDGELHFDYRLKKGVSKTMNASYLLEQMNIVKK